MGAAIVKVLRSNGENEVRAYAVVDLWPSHVEGAAEIERVLISDPRHTSTVRCGVGGTGSGPRNPAQMAWRLPKPPRIELPDALPATKAQRVLIDPELIAEWRAEARMKESA
jgi:hypothetical protein